MTPQITIQYKKIKITENFYMYEYFFPDYTHFYQLFAKPFQLSTILIGAAQIIRTHYAKPVIITSAYRPGLNQGFHGQIKAIDIVFEKGPLTLLSLKNDLLKHKEPSEIFTKLRKIGITGFGVEQTHVHLDIRDYRFNFSDEFGDYQLFQL